MSYEKRMSYARGVNLTDDIRVRAGQIQSGENSKCSETAALFLDFRTCDPQTLRQHVSAKRRESGILAKREADVCRYFRAPFPAAFWGRCVPQATKVAGCGGLLTP
jgi:hypothetical protein